MRSCDVSSDVCSSDLFVGPRLDGGARGQGAGARGLDVADLVAESSGRLSLRLGGDGVALPAAAVGVALGVGAAPVAVTGLVDGAAAVVAALLAHETPLVSGVGMGRDQV